MNSDSNFQTRIIHAGSIAVIAIVLMMISAACRDDAIGEIPEALPGTTWELDDFYITFVSESALNICDEIGQEVIAEGTYTVAGGVIEVAIGGRVRAGSWDGERLLVDGMVGRFVGAATQ